MNAGVPKQFLPLADKPILFYSLEAFHHFDREMLIVIALPAHHITLWSNLCTDHGLRVPHQVVAGGESRFDSVRSALQVIPDTGLVAIHDGVRPLISVALISRCFAKAATSGNCIPLVPVNESLRWIDGANCKPINREQVRLVQTPQVFDSAQIKAAYMQPFCKDFTDDATVLESTGKAIHFIEGEAENLKITRPADLFVAGELLVRRR
jgi:2-C-methyl-D-erythritol 4-phosphate cytidylyltransferase